MRVKDGFHESYREDDVAELPSERRFGLIVGGILVTISIVRQYIFDSRSLMMSAFLAVGAALVILAMAAPTSLRLPNRLWAQLGLLLSRIVNPVVMLVMFLGLFTPVAFFMRLKGRDILNLRTNPRSTWVERTPPGPDPKSAVNQF